MSKFIEQVSVVPAEPGWTITTDFGAGPEEEKIIAWAILVTTPDDITSLPLTILGSHPEYLGGVFRFNGVEQLR